jgi:GMP synthase-like glutamine amidotransferase
LDEQDAYMITGSPLSVLDQHVFTDALLDFIRRCDATQKPLLGACFGHQAIALALGGTVERSNQGYNVGVEETRFHETKDWMEPLRDSLQLYVFHEDQVTRLPEGCTLLGSSENCNIASFAKGDHIITTQAHPEFTYDFMACLLRFTEGKMPTATTKMAWDSLALDQDGSVFGSWAANFFRKALGDAR